jgi:hypothetical protein
MARPWCVPVTLFDDRVDGGIKSALKRLPQLIHDLFGVLKRGLRLLSNNGQGGLDGPLNGAGRDQLELVVGDIRIAPPRFFRMRQLRRVHDPKAPGEVLETNIHGSRERRQFPIDRLRVKPSA